MTISTPTSALRTPPPFHEHASEPRVLRCETTADFLAALPQLVGFTAENSLFVVFFAGKRSGSALRIDLPDSENTKEVFPFITGLVQLLLDLIGQYGASAPAIVITSAQSFAEVGGQPWRGLARGLNRRLNRAGIELRELCCLAPDAWVSYLDPAAPRMGRPLEDIAASPIAAEVAIPSLDTLGDFPDPDPGEIAPVLRRLADQEFAAPATCAAALIGPNDLGQDVRAGIIHAANTDDGYVTLCEQLVAASALIHHVTAPQDPSEFRPLLPESPGLLSVDRETAIEAADRLRDASLRLARLVMIAPQELRPSVIAVCAMAWWFRGLQSVALRQIEVALEIDPDHEIASFVRRLIESGQYPMAT